MNVITTCQHRDNSTGDRRKTTSLQPCRAGWAVTSRKTIGWGCWRTARAPQRRTRHCTPNPRRRTIRARRRVLWSASTADLRRARRGSQTRCRRRYPPHPIGQGLGGWSELALLDAFWGTGKRSRRIWRRQTRWPSAAYKTATHNSRLQMSPGRWRALEATRNQHYGKLLTSVKCDVSGHFITFDYWGKASADVRSHHLYEVIMKKVSHGLNKKDSRVRGPKWNDWCFFVRDSRWCWYLKNYNEIPQIGKTAATSCGSLNNIV